MGRHGDFSVFEISIGDDIFEGFPKFVSPAGSGRAPAGSLDRILNQRILFLGATHNQRKVIRPAIYSYVAREERCRMRGSQRPINAIVERRADMVKSGDRWVI